MRWLWLVAVVACGDNFVIDEPAETRGGSRLEPYWYDVDGTRESASIARLQTVDAFEAPAIRMFDTTLGEDCEIVPWADGVLRCTPGLQRWDWDHLDNTERIRVAVFADPECREPRGRASTAGSFLLGTWEGERFQIEGVVRGEQFVAPQATYFERRDGACVAAANDDGRAQWKISEVIPTSTLVTFEQREAVTTSRVGHQVVVGDDGSQIRTKLFDHGLDVPCFLSFDGEQTRCAPSETRSVANWFADPECMRPAVPITDEVTRFAYSFDEDSDCLTSYTLGNVETIPVYYFDGLACVRDGTRDVQVGTQLESPVVDYVTARQPGRIVDVLAAGATVGLFDTQFGHACSVNNDYFHPTLEPRCLPTHSSVEDNAFADASCSQPIAVAPRRQVRCNRGAAFALHPTYNAPLGDSTYAELAEPVEVFTVIDEHCIPLVPRDGYRYFTLGTEHRREDFSLATLAHHR